MRSPVVAMLWENWRLTRLEASQRFAVGILLPAAVLAGAAAFGPIGDGPAKGDAPAKWALFLLAWTYSPVWLSVMKLNGGRFMDGYRPGYPFFFLYARPVRTSVLVGVPMAYSVASAAALYLVSALILRATFGPPFPLLPLAAWIAAAHSAQWAAQWATSNKTVQWLGALAPFFVLAGLALRRAEEWPARLEFSIGDYALLATISVASFALTVIGVARQRRSDARAANPQWTTRSAFWDWLAGLFRIPCPTTSATRAQVWFELKSSGLPVLTIGLAFAIAIPLLLMIAVQIDVVLAGFYSRQAGMAGPASLMVGLGAAIFSLPTMLLLGRNAFGIRSRQGHNYASVFEASQAYGTARMAGLKVLLRAVCLMAALAAIVVSVWASFSFIAVSEGGRPLRHFEPMRGWQRAVEGSVGAMTADQQMALAFVTVIGLVTLIAWRASFAALQARYPRRVNLAVSLLLLTGLVLVGLTMAAQRWSGVATVGDVVFGTTAWVIAATIAVVTIYLFSNLMTDCVLTPRQTGVALLVSAAFGAAWVTVLRAGVQLAGAPPDAFWMLSPILLPLMVSALAPWSYSRVRHT